jgi:hypothetical protein
VAFEVPIAEDYDPDFQGIDAPAAGKYHCYIARLDEDGGKKGEMVVDYEVLAGTTPNQEGKVFRDYFHKTIKAMGRIHQLAMALGLVTAEQIKDAKARGQALTYHFAETAEGKHVMLDLYEEEYQGSMKTKCGYAIYSVTDPKCSGWPKNLGMLKAAGIDVPGPSANGAAAKAPASTVAKPKAAAAPSRQVAADIDNLLDGVV